MNRPGVPDERSPAAAACIKLSIIDNVFNDLPIVFASHTGIGASGSSKGQAGVRRKKQGKVLSARGAIFFITFSCDIYHTIPALRLRHATLWASVELGRVCDTIGACMGGNFHSGRKLANVARASLSLLCLCAFVMVFGRDAAEAAQGTLAGTSGFAPRFAIADFDGDRKPDLATVQVERDAVIGTRYSIQLQLSAGEESAIGITGPQGGLRISPRPFAIVIVGGLFTALFISIYLLPTMYVWVARDTDRLPLSDAEWEETT